jgi:tRNA G46 methylase TrmB
MWKTKVLVSTEYSTLIPPIPPADYENLKKSIAKEGGLLMPIILNQDKVVLDGHHRMRACKELGLDVTCDVKDFTDRPLDELRYVVTVNLHRRHLGEFQRAEIGLKWDKIARRIASERKAASQFTSETGREAVMKRHHGYNEDDGHDITSDIRHDHDITSDMRSVSRDTDRIEDEEDGPPLRSSQEIGNEVGVSASTIDRVRTILEVGSEEQISVLRERSQIGEGPGIRTVYEQIQNDKLKTKLAQSSSCGSSPDSQSVPLSMSDNLKLFNKDFRTMTPQEIPDQSVDLVLALDFPEPQIREDEGGRIHEQLMECASSWLKEGGLLVMYVEQRFLARAICARPPMLQFYHILSVLPSGIDFQQPSPNTMFTEEWRPYCVYVRGVRDTQPFSPESSTTSDRIGGGMETYSDQKDFIHEFIKRLSPSDSTICDPFMGEGIVGQAALELGRTYIGIEKETTMFHSAMNTLHEHPRTHTACSLHNLRSASIPITVLLTAAIILGEIRL